MGAESKVPIRPPVWTFHLSRAESFNVCWPARDERSDDPALINGVGDLVVSEKRWRSWGGPLLGAGITVVSSLTGYLLWTSLRHHR